MIIGSFVSTMAVLASLASLPASVAAQGQVVFDSEHNFTAITGTWSSGSKSVQTGPGFVNPANQTFKYPKNTGISYSFSDDGFYEIARYRFNANPTDPNCIQGVVNWVHGSHNIASNGSIILTPFGDGFQQIQTRCTAVSNFIEAYNITELVQQWRIFEDPQDGPKLHLFQFDGAPLAPMFQVSKTPIMLPTRMLRNVTTAPQVDLAQNPNGGVGRSAAGTVVVLGVAGALGLVSLIL